MVSFATQTASVRIIDEYWYYCAVLINDGNAVRKHAEQ